MCFMILYVPQNVFLDFLSTPPALNSHLFFLQMREYRTIDRTTIISRFRMYKVILDRKVLEEISNCDMHMRNRLNNHHEKIEKERVNKSLHHKFVDSLSSKVVISFRTVKFLSIIFYHHSIYFHAGKRS